jgi:hypothetical protein
MKHEILALLAVFALVLGAALIFRFQPAPQPDEGTIVVNRITGTQYFAGDDER